jgi:hypothetical protein
MYSHHDSNGRIRLDQRLLKMGTNDSKGIILALHNFPEKWREEVTRSNLSFLYISFGVVPERMNLSVFLDVLKLWKFRSNNLFALPLLPPVQDSWKGGQVADWLISARIVDESKRSIISEQLDGSRFIRGGAFDLLANEEIDKLFFELQTKISSIAPFVRNLIKGSSRQISLEGGVDFFEISFEKIPSVEEVREELTKKYSLTPSAMQELQLTFEQKYLKKELVAHSLIGHIVELRANSHEYFACYTTLEQSSGMGKSRLLHESWEDGEFALFILRISCAKGKELNVSGLETGKLVHYILKLRSVEQMSRLLCCLLYLVLDRAMDENGYLKDSKKLSHSIEDLGIAFRDVTEAYSSSYKHLNEEDCFKAIQSNILKMKLKKPNSDSVKTVIPVVAFDEAYILSKNIFEIEVPTDDPSGFESSRVHLFDSFRLIRRVLNSHRNELGQCPFIFAETNTMISSFAPSSPKVANFEHSSKGDEATTGATKIFRPYILVDTFGIFAKKMDFGSEEKRNWDAYINSKRYFQQLCKYGRPLWGALLKAGLTRGRNQIDTFYGIMEQAESMIAYDPQSEQDERLATTVAITTILFASDWASTTVANGIFKWKLALHTRSSKDQSKTLVAYPPEPVLAMGALMSLRKYASKILQDLISVNDLDVNNWLGSSDEIVAKLLLLLSVYSPGLRCDPCPTRYVLDFLLRREIMEELKEVENAEEFLKGQVCFSYFTTFRGFYEQPHENLGALIRLHAALSIPQRFNSTSGLFIPIVFKDGNLGCLTIQTMVDPLRFPQTSECSMRTFDPLPHSSKVPQLNIIMNMHSVSENFIIQEGTQCTTVLMEGPKTCFGVVFQRCPSLKVAVDLLFNR